MYRGHDIVHEVALEVIPFAILSYRIRLHCVSTSVSQAVFFGSLYTVASYLCDDSNTKTAHKVMTYLREATGSVPLISALTALVSRQSLTQFQKHAIVEVLYRLFRQIVPPAVASCVPIGVCTDDGVCLLSVVVAYCFAFL